MSEWVNEEKIKTATGFWLLATGKRSKWVDEWMRKKIDAEISNVIPNLFRNLLKERC